MTTPTRKQRSMTNRTLAYLNTFHTGPMTIELTAKIPAKLRKEYRLTPLRVASIWAGREMTADETMIVAKMLGADPSLALDFWRLDQQTKIGLEADDARRRFG
jgi:hypothetical protein